MNKKRINLIGGGFQHAKTSTLNKESDLFEWQFNTYKNNITVYVDYSIPLILKDNNKTQKIGWMLESKSIVPNLLEFVILNLEILKQNCLFIITHHSKLVELDPSFFKWAPAYGTYIDTIEIKNKNKLISMITSKKMITENHIKRINIANKYINKIDVFGRGFNEIEKKEIGLNDYAFSIAVENDCYDGYITEKILDCFATGTIPIYDGAPNIGKYFDINGIIKYDNFALEELTYDLYNSKKEYIINNLELVKQFDILDEWIYKKYLVDYV
jgi:hypothetical protein